MRSDALPAPGEPLVTIMIPAYNASRWIHDTLGAATAQTHRNLRILIADDGSTDGTRETVMQAAKADPRITLLQTPGRLRWVGNMNFLLDHATGDYACFLMHDDLVVADYISTLVAALEAHPGPGVAYGDMQTFSHVQNGAPVISGHARPVSSMVMHRARGRMMRCLAVLVEPCWGVAYRGLVPLSVLRNAPRPRLHGAGEYGADGPWVAALGVYASFVRVPRVLYFKREHATGVTSTWRWTSKTAAELTRSYREILAETPLVRSERAVIAAAIAARLATVQLGISKAQLRRGLQPRRSVASGSPTIQ